MTSQEFGKICRKARIQAGLTQVQVAQKTDIHVNYYSRIERGEVNLSLEIMNNILKVLKIKVSLP